MNIIRGIRSIARSVTTFSLFPRQPRNLRQANKWLMRNKARADAYAVQSTRQLIGVDSLDELTAPVIDWSQEPDIQCNGCDGTFKAEVMNPTSGDWWLCPKCFRRIVG